METFYDIYFRFKNNEMSQNEAFNYFYDILENTDDDRLILEILQIFTRIKDDDPRFLNILENLFVTNEDHRIKSKAIQLYALFNPKNITKIITIFLKSLTYMVEWGRW